jgi:hypothetical protein
VDVHVQVSHDPLLRSLYSTLSRSRAPPSCVVRWRSAYRGSLSCCAFSVEVCVERRCTCVGYRAVTKTAKILHIYFFGDAEDA